MARRSQAKPLASNGKPTRHLNARRVVCARRPRMLKLPPHSTSVRRTRGSVARPASRDRPCAPRAAPDPRRSRPSSGKPGRRQGVEGPERLQFGPGSTREPHDAHVPALRGPGEQAAELRRALQRPSFRCRDNRTVRPLVSCLQALVPGSRRNSGRARRSSRRGLSTRVCTGSTSARTRRFGRRDGSAETFISRYVTLPGRVFGVRSFRRRRSPGRGRA
jgi:hypothetical protein